MRIRILFIGSIVFTSQVVFAQTLVVLPQSLQTAVELPVAFEDAIAAELTAKGLENQAAKELSQNSVKDPYSATTLTNLLSAKLDVEPTKIHSYIASQALFQKQVDLRAHDDIVAMLQQIKGLSLQKQELTSVEEYISLV